MLHGASFRQANKVGIKGAIAGAISGAVAGGIGGGFMDLGNGWDMKAFKALAHGTSRAYMAYKKGENAKHAFISGFGGSGLSSGTMAYGDSLGFLGRTAVASIGAGLISESTGGDFASGATTGAFIHMFNHESHRQALPTKDEFVKIPGADYSTGNVRPFGEVLKDNAGTILAIGAGVTSGGVSLVLWGGGALLDGYSIYEHGGDMTYGLGSLGIPAAGKYGTVWSVGNGIYNGNMRD